MESRRSVSEDVRQVSAMIVQRAGDFAQDVEQALEGKFDTWRQIARLHPRSHQHPLVYVDYAISSGPTNPVVLGDAQHQRAHLDVVFQNAPQSLRNIEETTGFET